MIKHWFKAAVLLTVICSEAFSQSIDSRLFGDIKARWLGPSIMSGRIAAVDVVNNDVRYIYVGSASGGIWKSEDFGTTFKPIFDKYTQSIGAICIDQKNPQTVWAGTGESWVRNSVSVGTGIYKTTDAGLNWKKAGLDSSERIARIAVSPDNSDVVYVAVPGALWSDSKHRGLYKTSDGGKSWEKILYVDEKTGCADVVVDPKNPSILFTAMWQFRRTPYSFASGGPGSGIYKSVDAGKTWKKITSGLPSTQMGRIALAISPVNSSIVYSTIEYEKSAMFKSSDGGENWKRMGTTMQIVERPFYFARLYCDPRDTNTVYRCGLSLIITRDGGSSFSGAGGGNHGDDHDIWINPNNPNNIVMGTDGGLYISYNQGGTWSFCRSLPLSQFYHVMYDMEEPYRVYGGLQDNLSWYGPSRNNTGGVRTKDWFPFSFGDGFWTFPDATDNSIAYTETQGGSAVRYDMDLKILKDIQPHATGNEPKYRFNWNAAFTTSVNNKHKLFLGSQYVFTSYDKGETWNKISPDLTTNNPKYQQQENSGGVTADNSSAENHCSIYVIADSPLDSNLIWAGTDDGNIQLTKDGGKSWTNVAASLKDIPGEPWISSIETGHYDKGVAYVTLDYHNWGNMNTYVFKTSDYGTSWTKISNDSVKGFCHVVREDLKNPNLLFVGSEFGLFVSIDGGKNWAQLNYNNNIPNVPIRDVVIHPRDNEVILATHGRGIMIIDELGLNILRQLTPEIMQSKFTLFESSPYIIPLNGFDAGAATDDEFTGANPVSDPVVAYYLKDRQLVGDFRIEILDNDGSVINSTPAGKHKGVNIVSLPLSRKPPKVPPAPLIAGGATSGPALGEGTYDIRIIRNKDTVMTKITVQQEKNSPYTVEDRKIRLDAISKSYDMLNDFAYTVNGITNMRDDANKIAASLPEKDKLRKQLEMLAHTLDTLHAHVVYTREGMIVSEQAARLREKLSNNYGTFMFYEGRPNNSSLDQIKSLQTEINVTENTFNQILKNYLPKINPQLKEKGKPELVLKNREEFDKT